MPTYRGRFAPSPTGLLHAGSLVAALASWLDARAHAGHWLVRMEDVDSTRSMAGVDLLILQQLAACGLHPDEPVLYQSRRSDRYQAVLQQLLDQDAAYPCACSRKDIAMALEQQGASRARHGELVYPGTCALGLQGKPARAWRFRTCAGDLSWHDRRLGPQNQDVQTEVGDFVLKRADGCFAYQLAVVVDDADQGMTDVVRGEDLCDNTARQIQLQEVLGLPRPRYLHTPLVLATDGQKLSKQNGAERIDTDTPQAAARALSDAARHLGLPAWQTEQPNPPAPWVQAWRQAWGR
jgi:glutamyl-Q tRNA(Asp) synthetase